MNRLVLLFAVVLAGCSSPTYYDLDGDGTTDDLDCAPSDPEIHPGRPEVCDDGVDNDCDEESDCSDLDCLLEPSCQELFVDADGDGVTTLEGDCDDDDPLNFPGNDEACDGQDNDCNQDTEATGGEDDLDGDGALGCHDCDDTDATSATRDTDADCDGFLTEDDCDDSDELVYPGAQEVLADGVDNDCDGWIDCAAWGFFPLAGDASNDLEDGPNGTIQGAQPTVGPSGQANTALLFDGAGDTLHVGDPNFGGAGFTVAGWFRLDALEAGSTRLLFQEGVLELAIHGADGNFQLQLSVTNSDEEEESVAVEIDGAEAQFLGEWAYLAATWDRTTLKLLANDVGESVEFSGIPASNSVDVPLYVMSAPSLTSYSAGAVSELFVSSCGLPDQDLTDLFDGDGDGVAGPLDCNDEDPAALSRADDPNCDGVADGLSFTNPTHMTSLELVQLPGGEFSMGCSAQQGALMVDQGLSKDGCTANETPQHNVFLNHDFWMGRTEVTRGQWNQLFPDFNPSASSCTEDCDSLPVENLTWYEAISFANALSTLEGLPPCYEMNCADGLQPGQGQICTSVAVSGDPTNSVYDCAGYRLPTEAEWEHAARATTDLLFSGSNSWTSVAHTGDEGTTITAPQSIGALAPNFWGLYDMSGNVSEWVWDLYTTYPFPAPEMLTDPEGNCDGCTSRTARGGSWYQQPEGSRTTARLEYAPGYPLLTESNGATVGFRIARSAPGSGD